MAGGGLLPSGQSLRAVRLSWTPPSSATAFRSNPTVGTNAKHASTHQLGAKNRLIKAKRKKYLRFKVNGRWVMKKKVKVTIPARPFLGLSDDDMQEIQETTEDFLRRSGE